MPTGWEAISRKHPKLGEDKSDALTQLLGQVAGGDNKARIELVSGTLHPIQ